MWVEYFHLTYISRLMFFFFFLYPFTQLALFEMDFTLSLGPTSVDFPTENDTQQPIDVDTPEQIN